MEAARQRLPAAGQVLRSCTELTGPHIDWVKLACSLGVPAARVETAKQLQQQLCFALGSTEGPFLIEAALA